MPRDMIVLLDWLDADRAEDWLVLVIEHLPNSLKVTPSAGQDGKTFPSWSQEKFPWPRAVDQGAGLYYCAVLALVTSDGTDAGGSLTNRPSCWA